MPTELSPSQQYLWRFLSDMGNGEWDSAASILTSWDPKDFIPLVNAGIKVYTANTSDPADFNIEKHTQFLKLKTTIGNRAKDVSDRTLEELHMFQFKFSDPGSALPSIKQRAGLWNNGYYDRGKVENEKFDLNST
ncbi:hypothetical protein BGZ58_009678 [Dissophora ornata]|nr:hypothetical protein BGZ58_009678 [Dissophora ornata]